MTYWLGFIWRRQCYVIALFNDYVVARARQKQLTSRGLRVILRMAEEPPKLWERVEL